MRKRRERERERDEESLRIKSCGRIFNQADAVMNGGVSSEESHTGAMYSVGFSQGGMLLSWAFFEKL